MLQNVSWQSEKIVWRWNLLSIPVIVISVKQRWQRLSSSLPGRQSVPVFTKLPLCTMCPSASAQTLTALNKMKVKFTRASSVNSSEHVSPLLHVHVGFNAWLLLSKLESSRMLLQKDDLFLLVDDVNGKLNDGFLIFISPRKTLIILSENSSPSFIAMIASSIKLYLSEWAFMSWFAFFYLWPTGGFLGIWMFPSVHMWKSYIFWQRRLFVK